MSTIKDVARRTGLSLSTISKYLNGGNVREENRLAIDAAIEELDYSVNVFARSLKANRSMTIGVLLPTISSPFFGRVVAAMEPVLRRSGFAAGKPGLGRFGDHILIHGVPTAAAGAAAHPAGACLSAVGADVYGFQLRFFHSGLPVFIS